MRIGALFLTAVLATAQLGIESWARTLVPLLEDVRKAIGPRVTVEPGTLPPSPITGRSAALFAIRIGVDSLDVDERVVRTIDRLLEWRRTPKPFSDEEVAILTRWVDELRSRVAGRLLAQGKATTYCDDVCVAGHLTKPEGLFQGTPRQRAEERNRLLVEALAEAVLEPSADTDRR
jgi:hypothetical protein